MRHSRIAHPVPCIAMGAALSCIAGTLLAAEPPYPAKPIRLIIGQQIGSALDNAVRVVTPALGAALGQPIVNDNRPGLGGMVAMQVALAAAPDGYTLVNGGTPQMIAPFLFKKITYDFLKDFVPIARLTITQNVMIVPAGSPAKDVAGLISLLKSKPGHYNMASAGIGSASHLGGMQFNSMAAVDALHVPYKGGAAAVTALLANDAQYMITPLAAALGQIRNGNLRALAVAGERPAPQLPDVPTLHDAGVPGYRGSGWNALFAPIGTPAAAVSRVAAVSIDVVSRPDIQQKFIAAGVEAGPLAGEAFRVFMNDEMTRFSLLSKAAGLRPE